MNPFRAKRGKRIASELEPGDEITLSFIVRGFAPGCPLEEDRVMRGTVESVDFNVNLRDNLGRVWHIPTFWVTNAE